MYVHICQVGWMYNTRMKILVLTDHMPWGHRSIAKAIYGYLKPEETGQNWQVEYVEVKADTGIGGEWYNWAYRNWPAGNKLVVEMMNKLKSLRKLAIDFSYTKNKRGLLKTVLDKKPDLVISAYFYHTQALARLRTKKKLKFKLWTVVADPWSVNTLSFVEGADLHLVYDEVMEEEAIRFGIDFKKILITGWWTRQTMFDEINQLSKETIKQKMQLTEGIPTIFVGGGSLGTSSMSMLLPILLTLRKPVQVIFNTGKDAKMQKMISRFEQIIQKMPLIAKNLKIVSLGWIDNMAEILSVCDLVLGKAGPNFLFDVVAVGKPFVSITHIGGQEDGNLEIIRQKKLGWVRENPLSLARFLHSYLKKPKWVENKYKKSIEKESLSNQKCREILIEKIKMLSKAAF